jgi:hypothetical protein
MNAWKLRKTVVLRLRMLLGLMLALTFMPWALGPAAPVRAEDHPVTNPQIRLQVNVKKAYIDDDHDPIGSGELRLSATLLRCPAEPAQCSYRHGTTYLTESFYSFHGDTNEPSTIDWTAPTAADRSAPGYDLSEHAGYPLFDGERYLLRFEMWDRDPTNDDFLGWIEEYLGEDNQWRLGSHHGKASTDAKLFGGDFGLDYEILVTQLPNLLPFSIERHDVPGSSDVLVCVGVINAGAEPAGPFRVSLNFDGWAPRNGTIDVGGFGVGQVSTVCTITQHLPTTGGSHTWGATVDQEQWVPEMNERDNRFDEPLVLRPGEIPGQVSASATGPDPAPVASPAVPLAPTSPTSTPPAPAPAATSPTSTPSAARPDLIVSAIRVNGQAPDGRSDCKDGKNAVTVVVKNEGTANAGSFAVRLTADGGEALEQSVSGLEAGQEREVRFDDVRLKKGERQLRAIADARDSVGESNEGNNQLKATARCIDDD